MRSLATVALALAMSACGTSVQRMDAGEVKDVSGRWNDTDSRLVAEEMIQDCLSRPWYAAANSKLGRNPTVIVGTVKNQSQEHIATDTFVEDLQRSLINSGKVEFVANKGERGEVRDERLDQDTNSEESTRKAHGQETGADCSANLVDGADRQAAITLHRLRSILWRGTGRTIGW